MTPPEGPPCPDCGAKLKRFDRESWQCTANCGWYHDDEYPHLKPVLPLPEVDKGDGLEGWFPFEVIAHARQLRKDLAASRAEVESGAQAYNAIALDHEKQRQEIIRLNEALRLIADRSAELTALREENRRLLEQKSAWQDGRMEGRREAVSMLVQMDPESLDDCVGNAPNGDSGDYSSVWIIEKLRAKFDCDERDGAYEKLEEIYWTAKGEGLWMEDENRRLREWQPITGTPVHMKMILACAINPPELGQKYTTDPWAVWWDEKAKEYVRWPHKFPPTHYSEIPAAPDKGVEG